MQFFFLAAVSVFLIVLTTPVIAMVLHWQRIDTPLFLSSVTYGAIIVFVYMILIVVSRYIDYSTTRVLYYLIGVLIFGCTIAIVYWITYGLLSVPHLQTYMITPWVKYLSIGVWGIMIGVGVYNFHKPITVTQLEIVSDKVDRPVSFVYFADTQLGSTSRAHLDKTIRLINSLSPEFIAFGGDLVDFDDYEQSDFDVFETLTVPMYFITGNHEYYHQVQQVLSYLEKYPQVEVLQDQQVLTEQGVEITGVDYRNNVSAAVFSDTLATLLPSDDRFSLFLYHEPKRADLAAMHGYDLSLYGHSHGGQIFPLMVIEKATFGEFAAGTLRFVEKTQNRVYTTYGAGLWGPRMRLGTRNEVVQVRIMPK